MTVNLIGKNLPRPWTPDKPAELAVCASEHGAPVAVLWGNDDFCIIKKVREELRHDVIECMPKDHLQQVSMHFKRTTKELWVVKLQSTRWHVLGMYCPRTRAMCKACRKNLRAIVAHAFGKHHNCRTASASWCGFLQDPCTHKNKSLPRGKDPWDENLQKTFPLLWRAHINFWVTGLFWVTQCFY